MLIVVFLFSSISAIDLDWPAAGIAFAVVAGLGLLLAAWATINRLRGRRALEPPDRIGPVEIGVFLIVPTLLPVVFGGDMTGALITFATLAVILGVVYVITSYGLVAMAIWAARQMFRTLGDTFRLFTRSLPLLLLGFMFLFINAEAWQSAGRLERSLLIAAIALFALLAAAFLLTQIPKEMIGLERFSGWADVVRAAADGPIPKGEVAAPEPPSPPPLTRRERGNVWLVVFVSQAFRLILVSTLVAAFFVALGLLVIRPVTISLWTGATPTTLWTLTALDTELVLTQELVQVSAFLGAFAAVYFSVYTTTDRTLRSEFFEDTVGEVRQNLAVRAIYRVTVDDARKR